MRRSRVFGLLFCVCAVALYAAPPSVAAPPSNDNFADATEVTSLPFSNTVTEIAEATAEEGEPGSWCSAGNRNVWFKFTATESGVLSASAQASFYYTMLDVYRADGVDMTGLTHVGCNWYGQAVNFQAQAGETYYFRAGDNWSGTWIMPWDTLTFALDAIPAPPNDDFADAAVVTALPFADSQDLTGATIESSEPRTSCSEGFTRSVWYAFTPATSGLYQTSSFGQYANVAVYSGTSFSDLTQIACSGGGGMGAFHADAGTTYYLQTGIFQTSGAVETRVGVVPPPPVGFGWGPSYPSTFDTLTFYGQTCCDPVGIESWAWNFGDGTTSTASSPQHRYVKDGDYSVTVTGTTYDGRTNSDTQVVHVQTHDVSILWFSTVSKTRVGRTSPLQVGIGNTRYPETVQVDFYKSTPGGFQLIGTLTQTVPKMSKNKTTMFSLNYTFTEDDLAVGKVTFQAVATIQGNRPAIDAFAADNTATSLGTQVTR